jgi:hypothetical protein
MSTARFVTMRLLNLFAVQAAARLERDRLIQRDRERLEFAREACTLVLQSEMRGDDLQRQSALDLCAQVIGKAAYIALRHECGLPACDECGELCICRDDDT